MRQVRVRMVAGPQQIELVGHDSPMSFNTWKGAAKGAARDAQRWLLATLRAGEDEP